MDMNEKIQLDDITLDDIISGEGVATEEIAPAQEDEKKIESPEENTLDRESAVEEIEEIEDEDDKEIADEVEDREIEEEEEEEDVEEPSEAPSDTVIGEVLNKLGYEVESEYDDTSEGIAEMTKDVASQMADDRLDEVLEAFPLVKDHLQYVLNGGQSENFMTTHNPQADYNNIQLVEEDVHSQKAVLADYFTVKGHDREFINEMLGDYEDSGKLHTKAEAARQALGKVQAQEKKQMVENQKEMLREEQAQVSQFWNDISETIEESKEFAGITVPEKEKTKFFKYISTPVTREGYTQRDLDHVEADVNTKLAIDYLMYTGFNLDKLINTKANTKATKSLRDRISKNEETVKSARKRSRRSKNVDLDDLDLSI
jgi:hypothetical protein